MNPQEATEYDGPMSEEEYILTALLIMGLGREEARQELTSQGKAYAQAVAMVGSW